MSRYFENNFFHLKRLFKFSCFPFDGKVKAFPYQVFPLPVVRMAFRNE